MASKKDEDGFKKILEQLGIKTGPDSGNVTIETDALGTQHMEDGDEDDETNAAFKRATGHEMTDRVNNFDPANSGHVAALMQTFQSMLARMIQMNNVNPEKTIICITGKQPGDGKSEYSEVVFIGSIEQAMTEVADQFYKHTDKHTDVDEWQEGIIPDTKTH